MIVYDIDEKELWREREKGGELYYTEDDAGCKLYLQRAGHVLCSFHERPAPVVVDEEGKESPDTSYIIWKAEKLNYATKASKVLITGLPAPKVYKMEAVE